MGARVVILFVWDSFELYRLENQAPLDRYFRQAKEEVGTVKDSIFEIE